MKISDYQLREAITEIEYGLFEANLGGNIFKKRIAREGRGKSGGTRTIVAFRCNKNAFFVFGYAKNQRATLSIQEEIALKKLAGLYFSFNDCQIEVAIASGELMEVV